nr:hypothetical protein CFP56_02475 [Quercus suber]POF12300.1 hypothetical protein CFP56_71854 [Quercus suber]
MKKFIARIVVESVARIIAKIVAIARIVANGPTQKMKKFVARIVAESVARIIAKIVAIVRIVTRFALNGASSATV